MSLDLFGIPKTKSPKEVAEDEWVGMPEFVQPKSEPYKTLNIRFETEADYDAFAKLIDQKLTINTKSIWFPFKSHWRGIKKVYRDEP